MGVYMPIRGSGFSGFGGFIFKQIKIKKIMSTNNNSVGLKVIYKAENLNEKLKRTSLRLFPGFSGNSIYATASEPFIKGHHKPGKAFYKATLKEVDDCEIVKITSNQTNGSNTVWLERDKELMFLIIRDSVQFQQFQKVFVSKFHGKISTIKFENSNWIIS